ncbi:AraC family transcriptional regulator [Bacillus solitudinis]|uniref:AraC family transcriptional regulator n=1 Tax=Bacillus solitudinis TaxID=2014074 RepID=UPI000C23747C|nr:AraC family transcriptional regulator [Bacillus solitudinis]
MYFWKRFKSAELKVRERQKTVLIRLLTSYILVLILPITIGVLLFIKIESIMIDNSNESNIAMLEQVKQVVDNRLQEVEQFSVQISKNQKLIKLLNEEKEHNYDYVKFINELANYQTVSTIIDDYYVYSPKFNTILSSSMKTTPAMLFNHIKRYDNSSYEEVVKERLSGFHLNHYYPSEKVVMNSGEKNIITFVQSLPYGEKLNIKGMFLVHIDEQEIREMFHQIEGLNSGFMYIVDGNNNIMLSTSKSEKYFNQIYPLLNKRAGFFEKSIEGNEMIVSYTSSEKNGWTYASVVPKNIVIAQVNEVKSWAMIVMAVLFIIGILLSFYLANKNYRPIREIVNTVIGKSRPNGEFQNEIELIKQTIVSSMKKESQLSQIVLQQEPVIKSNFMYRLLKGQVDVDNVSRNDLSFMGLFPKFNYYSVLLVQIDGYCQFRNENLETEWALTRFIITNLSNDLSNGNGFTIDIERDKIAILQNYPKNTSDEHTKQITFIKRLKEVLEREFNINITVAISYIHHGLHNLAQCYVEASMALDYRMVKGLGSIIFYRDVENNDYYYYYYPLETEMKLINYAKAGDSANVEKTLDDIINLQKQGMTPEISKCLSYDLLSTLIKLSSLLNGEDKTQLIDLNRLLKSITDSSTVEEIQEKIKQQYKVVCLKIQEKQLSQSERLYQDIKKYIDDNYGGDKLCLTMIAEYFGMNPSYLSTFFKKQGNQTISDYLTMVRVTETKKMLSNRMLTISEIAKKVGYANSVGLIRVFKKSEGVTPGQYREIM